MIIRAEDLIGSVPGLFPSLPSWSPGESTSTLEDVAPYVGQWSLKLEALRNGTTPIPHRTGDNRRQVSCYSHIVSCCLFLMVEVLWAKHSLLPHSDTHDEGRGQYHVIVTPSHEYPGVDA